MKTRFGVMVGLAVMVVIMVACGGKKPPIARPTPLPVEYRPLPRQRRIRPAAA